MAMQSLRHYYPSHIITQSGRRNMNARLRLLPLRRLEPENRRMILR